MLVKKWYDTSGLSIETLAKQEKEKKDKKKKDEKKTANKPAGVQVSTTPSTAAILSAIDAILKRSSALQEKLEKHAASVSTKPTTAASPANPPAPTSSTVKTTAPKPAVSVSVAAAPMPQKKWYDTSGLSIETLAKQSQKPTIRTGSTPARAVSATSSRPPDYTARSTSSTAGHASTKTGATDTTSSTSHVPQHQVKPAGWRPPAVDGFTSVGAAVRAALKEQRKSQKASTSTVATKKSTTPARTVSTTPTPVSKKQAIGKKLEKLEKSAATRTHTPTGTRQKSTTTPSKTRSTAHTPSSTSSAIPKKWYDTSGSSIETLASKAKRVTSPSKKTPTASRQTSGANTFTTATVKPGVERPSAEKAQRKRVQARIRYVTIYRIHYIDRVVKVPRIVTVLRTHTVYVRKHVPILV